MYLNSLGILMEYKFEVWWDEQLSLQGKEFEPYFTANVLRSILIGSPVRTQVVSQNSTTSS